jgi:thioesterase III
MVIKTTIKVRGYHLDMYRHVNNARFLEFLEEGRWAFFDENPNFDGWPHGIHFVVVNINISYRRPATLGDILEVGTNITHLGSKSGIMHQEIVLQGTDSIIADADVTFVIVDSKTQKALSLEGNLLALLERVVDQKNSAEINVV